MASPVPLLKAARRVGTKRVSIGERRPTALILEAHGDGGGADASAGAALSAGARVCRVCAQQQAAYTCPTCRVPYCSVVCYRAHGESCTERFYRQHVEQELALRERATAAEDPRKERQRDAERLLARVQEFHRETEAAWQEEDGDGDDGDGDDDAWTDKLARLATMRADELSLDCLTLDEQQRFLRDVASGRLSNLIVPWAPWWRLPVRVYEQETRVRRERLIQLESDGDDQDDRVQQAITIPAQAAGVALDEDDAQLIAPSATYPAQLFSRYEQQQIESMRLPTRASPLLVLHVVEVVWAYALMLRTYHGDWRQDATDATSLLLQLCDVLQQDARYETLEQVAEACRNKFQVCMGDTRDQVSHTFADAVLLLQERVFLLDALADMREMVRVCCKETEQDVVKVKTKAEKKRVRQYGRHLMAVEKKLTFFLGWAVRQEHEDVRSTAHALELWTQRQDQNKVAAM